MNDGENASLLLAELSAVDTLDAAIDHQASRVRLLFWAWVLATGLIVAGASTLSLVYLLLVVFGFCVFAGALTRPARRRLQALKREKACLLLQSAKSTGAEGP